MRLSRELNRDPQLILFDLDHTLLAADTNSLWLNFLADQGYLDKDLINQQQQRWYADYVNGCLDFVAYMRFQLQPLCDIPQKVLPGLLKVFSEEMLAPNIAPGAASLVKGHQEQRHICAVVTATHYLLAELAAKQIKIEHLIATEAELIDDIFTGHPGRTLCFGKGKITAIEQWLEQAGVEPSLLDQATFYSDSSNDLPLLERVANPVAVDPDARLKAIANERGWPTISLRPGSASANESLIHERNHHVSQRN